MLSWAVFTTYESSSKRFIHLAILDVWNIYSPHNLESWQISWFSYMVEQNKFPNDTVHAGEISLVAKILSLKIEYNIQDCPFVISRYIIHK